MFISQLIEGKMVDSEVSPISIKGVQISAILLSEEFQFSLSQNQVEINFFSMRIFSVETLVKFIKNIVHSSCVSDYFLNFGKFQIPESKVISFGI